MRCLRLEAPQRLRHFERAWKLSGIISPPAPSVAQKTPVQALAQMRNRIQELQKSGFEVIFHVPFPRSQRLLNKAVGSPVLLPALLWRQRIRAARNNRTRRIKIIQVPAMAPNALLSPRDEAEPSSSERHVRDMDETKFFRETRYIAPPGSQPVFRTFQLRRLQKKFPRRSLGAASSQSMQWYQLLRELFPGSHLPAISTKPAHGTATKRRRTSSTNEKAIVLPTVTDSSGTTFMSPVQAQQTVHVRRQRRRAVYAKRKESGRAKRKVLVFNGDVLPEEDAEEYFEEDNPYSLREHSHSQHRGHPQFITVQRFLEYGYAILGEEHALKAEQVAACEERVLQRYNHVIMTVKALDLGRELERGWATFKLRNLGRYDMVIEEFLSSKEFSFLHEERVFPKQLFWGTCKIYLEYLFLEYLADDAPWLPAVKLLLGDDCKCVHTGCMLSLPGSETQPWHSDGPHLSTSKHLPPHAVNVFLPLVDLTPQIGPTEFVPTSHITWATKAKTVIPCPKAGQALLFDYRLKHRGLGNRTADEIRPLIYMTYGAATWKDPYNFSKKRYRALPPLIDLSCRGTREERLAKRLKRQQNNHEAEAPVP